MSVSVLVLPGYASSGPEHWQTLWEHRHGYTRVEQDDWERPDLASWKRRLHDAVERAESPIVLVAHSLGCTLVAHCAGDAIAGRIAAALLVAPPDVDEIRHLMPEVETFAPVPMGPLPFPSIVVASTNDTYAEPARGRAFAHAWGSRLVELPEAGHINAESNLGEWPEGHGLLQELLRVTKG